MADERLTNLAMISIESETAKILDMTELTKALQMLKSVCFIRCVENAFISIR